MVELCMSMYGGVRMFKIVELQIGFLYFRFN